MLRKLRTLTPGAIQHNALAPIQLYMNALEVDSPAVLTGKSTCRVGQWDLLEQLSQRRAPDDTHLGAVHCLQVLGAVHRLLPPHLATVDTPQRVVQCVSRRGNAASGGRVLHHSSRHACRAGCAARREELAVPAAPPAATATRSRPSRRQRQPVAREKSFHSTTFGPPSAWQSNCNLHRAPFPQQLKHRAPGRLGLCLRPWPCARRPVSDASECEALCRPERRCSRLRGPRSDQEDAQPAH